MITTVSTKDKGELSEQAGADHVLVGYDGFAERVRELTDGRGAQAVYDGVGKETFDGSLARAGPARHDGAVRGVQRPGATV